MSPEPGLVGLNAVKFAVIFDTLTGRLLANAILADDVLNVAPGTTLSLTSSSILKVL